LSDRDDEHHSQQGAPTAAEAKLAVEDLGSEALLSIEGRVPWDVVLKTLELLKPELLTENDAQSSREQP